MGSFMSKPMDGSAKKYRILLLTPSFGPGKNGIASVVYEHARQFVRHGHEVVVFTHDKSVEQDYAEGLEHGIPVCLFNVHPGRGFEKSVAARLFCDRLKAFDGDFIITHGALQWNSRLLENVASGISCPKIRVAHGYHLPLETDFKTLRIWLARTLQLAFRLRRYDQLVFLWDKNRPAGYLDLMLARTLGMKNISFIPNGMDSLEGTGGCFKKENGLAQEPMLICVSNFFEHKNQMAVLKAFCEADVKNASLVFIGSSRTPYLEKLEACWCKNKPRCAGRSVFFLTNIPRKDVEQAMLESTGFIFASKAECMPMVILESMAAGVPFISSRNGCVDDLPGGIVFKTHRQLIRAIEQLVARPENASMLGAQGKVYVRKCLSWEKVYGQYEELFKRLSEQVNRRGERRML
jgi:glycosyltransferase involved in cell wall biosynthesis